MSQTVAPTPGMVRTRVLAGVTVPDSPLVAAAIDLVRRHSEPYLFNHAVRSWLFAVRLGQLEGVRCDPAVVAVGTLLHDLGLTDSFTGSRRFEVEGADTARAFARQEGMDECQLQLIWDSVALNSTPSIALFKEPEVALVTAGIGVEFGFQYSTIPATDMHNILEAYPRLEMKRRFAHDVCRIVESRPETTYDNFAGDFGERFVAGYRRASTVDYLMNAPFGE